MSEMQGAWLLIAIVGAAVVFGLAGQWQYAAMEMIVVALVVIGLAIPRAIAQHREQERLRELALRERVALLERENAALDVLLESQHSDGLSERILQTRA